MQIQWRNSKPEVAVITPVFNEAESLPQYFLEARKIAVSNTAFNFTFYLIDDGSTDCSWKSISNESISNPSIKGVRLKRNYGSHSAIAAGIFKANADIYVVLCCDLQDPPDKIPEMLQKCISGFDIVWGHRNLDKDGFIEGFLRKFFYYVMNKFACPRGTVYTTGSFYMFSRKVADSIKNTESFSGMMEPLIAATRFKQSSVYYIRHPRKSGSSGWTTSSKLRALKDLIMKNTSIPVLLPVFAGLFLIVASLLSISLFSNSVNTERSVYSTFFFNLYLLTGLLFILMGVFAGYYKKNMSGSMPQSINSILESTGFKGDYERE